MANGFLDWDLIKPKITPKFLLFAFVLGAVVGTTGDFVHVVTGTDGYPADGPFPFLPFLPARMPVWVPFLFGGAVMLMGSVHKLFSHTYQPRLAGVKNLAVASPVLLLALYASTGFVQLDGWWQDLWIATFAIALWWLLDRTVTGALLALVTAFGGTAFEIMLVQVGGFYYLPGHNGLFGVPSWLPWLYVDVSVCVSLVVRWI